MRTVREIVNGRNRELLFISPETTVQAALQIMSTELVSALPVMEGNKLVGIISERDYVRKIASQRIPAWSVKIHEVMTREVITVDIDSPVTDCMSLMTKNRIRHLPVMDNTVLKTIISITDVLSILEPEQDQED